MREDYGVREITPEEQAAISNLLRNLRNQKTRGDPFEELERAAEIYISDPQNRTDICKALVVGRLSAESDKLALNSVVRQQRMQTVRREFEKFKES